MHVPKSELRDYPTAELHKLQRMMLNAAVTIERMSHDGSPMNLKQLHDANLATATRITTVLDERNEDVRDDLREDIRGSEED